MFHLRALGEVRALLTLLAKRTMLAGAPASFAHQLLVPSANVHGVWSVHRSCAATMTTRSESDSDDAQIEAIFEKKRTLRTQIRKALRCMSSAQRAQEENCMQNRKALYLPRIEDRNSNMMMLRISSYGDLIPNSMDIVEPSPLDLNGNQREDAMQANEPVDLFILPGLAFDRAGRRLGRSGGYYDLYLKKYREVAMERRWKQPLHVALAYSVQVVDDGAIGVTSDDVPVDAIVSPSGVIHRVPA